MEKKGFCDVWINGISSGRWRAGGPFPGAGYAVRSESDGSGIPLSARCSRNPTSQLQGLGRSQ